MMEKNSAGIILCQCTLILRNNKNECSVAATGPPIFEGPRENPKSLSSSKAEKFDFLFLHSVLWGWGVHYHLGSLGDPAGGARENPRYLSSPKAEIFAFLFLHSVLFFGGVT